MKSSNYFLYRRLHSLSGVVPLGLFLLEHVISNSYALYGAERFNAQVRFLHSLPFMLGIEVLLIFVPLLYHGLYGAYIVFTGQFNAAHYGYSRNWVYLLQRLTGAITLAFVTWHVWTLWLQDRLAGRVVTYADMVALFQNPVIAVIYTIGMLSALYHFTNGLWGFAVDWGLVIGTRAQRTLARVTWVLFGLLSVATVAFMVAFTRV
ncbi:MAG: succinate dehydrogenase/fumarate reductase transmembrane subunit [Bacillota bacterium]